MCDPRWIYGISAELDTLYQYAKEKAPECCRPDRLTTCNAVIEKFGRRFRQMLLPDIGIDIYDEEFEPKLVLILHREYPGSSKFTLEDEEYIRKELGIEEKGKWYRYVGSFFLDDLEKYKKTIPGPIPSRVDTMNITSNEPSSDVVQLSQSVAAIKV